MATQDIKDYLFSQTGIAQNQWKRLSKTKNEDGLEVRVFQDKTSGKILETIEAKDGTITISKELLETDLKKSKKSSPSNDTDNKKTLKLIKQYYLQEDQIDSSMDGFAQIPKYFKFSFLEDSNVDHPDLLDDAANSGNPAISVTSFVLFFQPTLNVSDEVLHLEPLLKSFLPEFIGEVEEAAFAVYPDTVHIYDDERDTAIEDGTIPYVPYNELVATLEDAGFNYDVKKCHLAQLGGSQGANPLKSKLKI